MRSRRCGLGAANVGAQRATKANATALILALLALKVGGSWRWQLRDATARAESETDAFGDYA